MATKKPPTSIRLSPEARELMRKLAERLGISQSAAMELAIRLLAQREGITKDRE